MPVYEFECDAHGCFDEQRPMALAKSSAPCPSCGTDARRVLSVPHVAQLARSERRARDINEKNAHERMQVDAVSRYGLIRLGDAYETDTAMTIESGCWCIGLFAPAARKPRSTRTEGLSRTTL